MSDDKALGGRFTFPGTTTTVNRMGYGAMRLSGEGIFGPPKDRAGAVAVLRAAVEAGVDHIDTSDFYGPHVTNEIIREALSPYPDALTIVTKIGARRPPAGSWVAAMSKEELTSAVEDNLRNLGLEALDVVNLRLMGGGAGHGPAEGSLAEPMGVLIDLKAQGKVRNIGVSNVIAAQVTEARGMTDIVCVQNQYNLAHREDDAMLDDLARAGIAYVPFFPLGGFSPLQSGMLDEVAKSVEATPLQVALAWLLQRSPNLLLIPGTSSVDHLRQNIAAADLRLPEDALAKLNAMAG